LRKWEGLGALKVTELGIEVDKGGKITCARRDGHKLRESEKKKF